MEKIKIVSIHMERDVSNNTPTIVFTDEFECEWVHPASFCGYITELVKKEDSFSFKEQKGTSKQQ